MEPGQQPDQPTIGPNGKAEKLPAAKLHAAQYIIALILAILISGLWRLQILNAENFAPVRVVTNSGKSYEIPLAAFAYVAGTTLVIVPTVKPGSHEASERATSVALRNITAIEPLPEPAA